MRCPSCGNIESKVVDSRPSEDGTAIRRRRECLDCGRRFTTYERLGDNPLTACAKRPISPEQIASLIDSIETELRNASRNEIRSKELGDMALARLAKLDDVAYVRFASVYKDFQNVEEFASALEGLRS